MSELALSAVSDILESFDIDEISKLLREQILERENYNESAVDQFQPLYANYKKLLRLEEEGEDETEVSEGIMKFYEICRIILSLIQEKFNVYVADDWLETHQKDIPSVTFAFYSFFVLNIYTNVYEILRNYITANAKEIYEQFKDIPKKGGNIGVDVSPEAECIMRNIYDICSYVFQTISSENVMRYMESGYVPGIIIDQLRQNGSLFGDFIFVIGEIFESNISFKAQIGFDIIYRIRNGSISI